MKPSKTDRARRIGVTGGVGCGKSELLSYMERVHGAAVLRSDDIAREIMEPGGRCFQAACALFGKEAITEEGSLDRTRIAALVFADKSLLQKLNALVHPAVWEEVRERIAREEAAGRPIVCVESALFVEPEHLAPAREVFDELWYIYACEEVRRSRLAASRGYSEKKIDDMMASQPGEEAFRAACSAVVDNSGPLEDSFAQIDRLLEAPSKCASRKTGEEGED